MKIFTNKDIRNFFIGIVCVSGGLLALIQLMTWWLYGELNLVLLLFSLLVVVSILGICFLYFQKQNQVIDDAVMQINNYFAGNTDSRIVCNQEGSLYKLFHEVNMLATVLGAHADNEQKAKKFLKETLSDISHQLKTPLAALNIYNALLQDDTEGIDAKREFAMKSEKEIDRIGMLVQNLLKITRLDAGYILIERTSENVADIMEDIKQSFEFRMSSEEISLTLSGAENLQLFCDRHWMIEAVSNIVKNAFDHTETNGHIDIRWEKLSTAIQITIKDDGSGIYPEDIYHIFKRFYRSRFSKDTQGLGLGLPLAKAIVEAHEGTITVESNLGKETLFSLSFPNLTKL